MRRSPISAVLVVLVLLAGCGTSGGKEATSSGGTATTRSTSGASGDGTSPGSASTTQAPSASTTTKPRRAITSAALEAILPEAADIGPGYTKDDSSGSGSSSDGSSSPEEDAAMAKACPELAKLDVLSSKGNADEVSASFSTAKDQGIEVDLDPTPDAVTADTVDAVVAAFKKCGKITITSTDGVPMTMQVDAEKLDGYGDFGAELTLDASFEAFGTKLTVTIHGYLFDVNGVGVTIDATSGLDDSFSVVPADDDLLPKIAREMEQRVRDLTD